MGLAGVIRGKPVKTTVSDKAAHQGPKKWRHLASETASAGGRALSQHGRNLWHHKCPALIAAAKAC
jgi:hypothetical protein